MVLPGISYPEVMGHDWASILLSFYATKGGVWGPMAAMIFAFISGNELATYLIGN